jgi:hypothetical protein
MLESVGRGIMGIYSAPQEYAQAVFYIYAGYKQQVLDKNRFIFKISVLRNCEKRG